MESLMPLLLLSVCSAALSEPLSAAIKRRSDVGVYASDFAREYVPYAYVAIPLHSPIPVLHLLSNAPLVAPPRPKRGSSPKTRGQNRQRPTNAPYSTEQYAQAQSKPYPAIAPYPTIGSYPTVGSYPPIGPYPTIGSYPTVGPYAQYAPQVYASTMTHALYATPRPEDIEPMVLYARPKQNGGYSYRKQPTKKKNKPKREPMIIRVHKYRIIRD